MSQSSGIYRGWCYWIPLFLTDIEWKLLKIHDYTQPSFFLSSAPLEIMAKQETHSPLKRDVWRLLSKGTVHQRKAELRGIKKDGEVPWGKQQQEASRKNGYWEPLKVPRNSHTIGAVASDRKTHREGAKEIHMATSLFPISFSNQKLKGNGAWFTQFMRSTSWNVEQNKAREWSPKGRLRIFSKDSVSSISMHRVPNIIIEIASFKRTG